MKGKRTALQNVSSLPPRSGPLTQNRTKINLKWLKEEQLEGSKPHSPHMMHNMRSQLERRSLEDQQIDTQLMFYKIVHGYVAIQLQTYVVLRQTLEIPHAPSLILLPAFTILFLPRISSSLEQTPFWKILTPTRKKSEISIINHPKFNTLF